MGAKQFIWMALLAIAQGVSAQTYRCQGDGGAYLSDRPCEGTNTGKLGSFGPARSWSPGHQLLPRNRTPAAEPFARYLNAECASIYDAIRTGPSRGVMPDVINALRKEYQDKCKFEEQEAMRRVSADDDRRMRDNQAAREARVAQRQQVQQLSDQCFSMRDAIASRRKREAELKPAEVESLRNLERAYNERCIAVAR
jgi:hypothetical protein